MSTSRKELKDSQRSRLLNGMLAAAAQRGYLGATVAETIGRARVSRPTFYEYFSDRDDCFLAVHREISETPIERVREAVELAPPERAVQEGVKALILFAEACPEKARFLINETLVAGRRALEHRDRTIQRLARIIERRRSAAPPAADTPDLPTDALIGGVYGLLAPRLRRNEHDLRALADDIAAWIDSYRAPTSSHRWRAHKPGPVLGPPEHVAELELRRPPPLPPGRPSISSAEVARNQRERILHATAEVAIRKGYAAMTVADITQDAGVDRRVFYANFGDKQQAFLSVYELCVQQMMAVCARAFFISGTWQERIWEVLRAGTHFNATYPVFSQLGYVEAHAVGGQAIQRVEDSHAAFSMFLQEGYLQTDSPPPRCALTAIAATIYELGYLHVRRQEVEQLPRYVPRAAHIVLAPFLGTEAAADFIDRALEEQSTKRV